MSTSQSQNEMQQADWERIVARLECQLAEAQQAREQAEEEIAEYKSEQWCFNEGHVSSHVHSVVVRECDTLRGLLREALALIRVANHWDKLSEVRSFCERATAALKEGE